MYVRLSTYDTYVILTSIPSELCPALLVPDQGAGGRISFPLLPPENTHPHGINTIYNESESAAVEVTAPVLNDFTQENRHGYLAITMEYDNEN